MNTPKTPLGRLMNIKTIGNQTVSQVMNDMDEVGAGEVSTAFSDNNGNVLGAIVFLSGKDTQVYLNAIEATREKLENEDQE